MRSSPILVLSTENIVLTYLERPDCEWNPGLTLLWIGGALQWSKSCLWVHHFVAGLEFTSILVRAMASGLTLSPFFDASSTASGALFSPS